MRRVLGSLALFLTIALVAPDPAAAAAPAAPGSLTGTSFEDGQLELQWVDHSNNELGFRFEISTVAEPEWSVLGDVGANLTAASLTGLDVGTTYRFRMRAGNTDGFSPFSNTFELTIHALSPSSSLCEMNVVGSPFQYTVETPSAPPDRVVAISDLPAGLAVEPDGLTVSGTLEEPAIASFLVTVTAAHHAARRNRVGIFALSGPRSIGDDPQIEVVSGADPASIDLGTLFDDPDTETIVRFVTSEGGIDVALTDSAAPLTVANFLAYADADAWDGTFFHRAVPGFVNQGGGYRPDGGSFVSIPDNPPVQNEFGTDRRNVCGTVSMAKLGGDPDSATNEWFFSVGDNSANLDNQNGGFTVFGRVMGEGMDIVRAINQLPTDTYAITLDGQPRSFSDWPLRNGATSPTQPGALVTVSDVGRIPPLVHSIASPPPDGLATAEIQGSMLRLAASSGSAGGGAEVVVRVVDRDGLETTRAVPFTVLRGFDGWIAAADGVPPDKRGPLDDPEQDGLPHLAEFALGADPGRSDAHTHAPSGSAVVVVDSASHPALTFFLADHVAGITAVVERSTDAVAWQPVWSTTDGLESPFVVEVIPSGTPAAPDASTRITVRSDLPQSEAPTQILRLRIALE